jgi:hypothetical protein
MGVLVWNPEISTMVLAFYALELKELGAAIKLFDAVGVFQVCVALSLYIDTGQERCRFSWPTKRQIINVGVDGANCQRA